MKVLNKNQRESVSGGYDLCDFVGDATKLFFASVGTVVGTVAGGFPGGVAGNAIGTMAGNMAADVFTRDMGCKRDEGDIFRKVN